MILYHGTNEDIEAIDLNRGLRHKDFGKGFYLTPDRNTAIRMAQKKTRLFGGSATLITYELDDAVIQSDLKVKVFPEQAAAQLQDKYLDQQYYFGTEQALQFLHKTNVESV